MADPQDVSDLEDLLRRRGNAMVTQQAAFVQNTLDIDLPVEEDEEQPTEGGRLRRPVKVARGMAGVDVVNIQKGGTSGAGTYADQSARPAGSGRPKYQGKKLPVLYSSVVQFSLGEIDIADGGGDGIDAHIETIRAHGSMTGALWARAINDPQVAEPTTDVAAASTTMSVPEINGYIEGATYDVVVDATGVVVGSFDAETVAGDFDGAAVITFGAALSFTIDVSEQSIFLRGQGDSDTAFGSLADFTDNTLTMYGLTLANFPAGILEDVSAAFSNADGKRAVSILTPFCQPNAWLTTPIDRDKIVNAQEDNVRFIPGQGNNNRDPFHDAMLPEFAGLPIVACPQAVAGDIVLADFSAVEFREHIPYAPQRAQGAGPGSWDKASLIPSEALHAYKLPCRGWFSTVTKKRRSFLRFTNVTS